MADQKREDKTFGDRYLKAYRSELTRRSQDEGPEEGKKLPHGLVDASKKVQALEGEEYKRAKKGLRHKVWNAIGEADKRLTDATKISFLYWKGEPNNDLSKVRFDLEFTKDTAKQYRGRLEERPKYPQDKDQLNALCASFPWIKPERPNDLGVWHFVATLEELEKLRDQH